MLERLIDLLATGWENLTPVVVIHAFEKAVVLRLGKVDRTLEPGWHWKIPFADSVYQVHSAITTMRLPPQTLTTSDDITVGVSAIIKYKVINPVPYTVDLWDQSDALGDVGMGAIRKAVFGVTWADLKKNPPERTVLEELRGQVNKYGFKIETVTFVDLCRVKVYRLVGDNAPMHLDH